MKNIVISDDYNAVDLKPSDLIHRYIDLTKADVAKMIATSKLKDCNCPACGSSQKRLAFTKFSLSYQECSTCYSLYVSPRPSFETLQDYYQNSSARAYWRDVLFKATDKKRKEKIVKPRFQWILESTREYLPKATTWVDFNTTQSSYVEAMLDADMFSRKILLNPYIDTKNYAGRVEVVNQAMWAQTLNNSADVITLFEVVDHTSSVSGLFDAVRHMLKKDGLCFLTAILSSGFDIQLLWDKADNLYPPDRLNCLSADGFKMLCSTNGFECLEFSTPGILDVEIVAKAYKNNPQLDVPRFVRDLIESKDEETRKAFQEFLQSACMSSYGRILIRKTRG